MLKVPRVQQCLDLQVWLGSTVPVYVCVCVFVMCFIFNIGVLCMYTCIYSCSLYYTMSGG